LRDCFIVWTLADELDFFPFELLSLFTDFPGSADHLVSFLFNLLYIVKIQNVKGNPSQGLRILNMIHIGAI